jgi:hypothetical protein
MLDDFPTKHGPTREAKILECVREEYRTKYNFVKIKSEHNGHTAEFLVFDDALKIDGVRVNVTAITQQQIADLLRCILPTAKLYDLMWHLCEHKVEPLPRPITSTTKAMIEHSLDIDEKLIEMDPPTPPGLNSTVGKTWIVDNVLAAKPSKACNHGWHFTKGTTYKGIGGNVNPALLKNPDTGQYWYMIQARGTHHGPSHVDYSQVCVLVSRQCWVDGIERDIHDVLSDPELAPLANHDGVLKVLRQPGADELDPIADLPVKPPPPPPPPRPPEPPISEDPVTVPIPNPIVPVPPSPPVIEYEPPSGIWTWVVNIIRMIISLFGRKK